MGFRSCSKEEEEDTETIDISAMSITKSICEASSPTRNNQIRNNSSNSSNTNKLSNGAQAAKSLPMSLGSRLYYITQLSAFTATANHDSNGDHSDKGADGHSYSSPLLPHSYGVFDGLDPQHYIFNLT